MCRRILLSVAFLLASVPGCLAAFASSDAILIDFSFTLPDTVWASYAGGDVLDCVYFGNAGCILVDDQVNFGLMQKPFGYLYSIRHEYYVEASAPPPDFSEAFFRLTSFFNFHNTSDDDVPVKINWTVTYELFAEGNFSAASIGIDWGIKGPDDPNYRNSALFAPVSCTDPCDLAGNPMGAIDLLLAPGDSSWRIEDPIDAIAAVPEPGTLGFLCTGLFAAAARRGYRLGKIVTSCG